MKINATLVIVIAAILIAGGLLIFSGDSGQTDKVEMTRSHSALTADRELHDFGELDIFGGVVTTGFVLANGGPDDITVFDGTTSCGCTSAEIGGVSFGMHEEMSTSVVIPAGETRELTVIYDPLAHGPSGVGLAQRSVFLKTNSGVTSELEVRIKAMVVNNKE